MKKKNITKIVFFSFVLSLFGVIPVGAASAFDVVINEVAWAGSVDSAADEWIELYNNTSLDVDLTGWIIEDDGNALPSLSGIIPAHGYYLIEDSESVVNPNVADAVIGLSLANSGDSLVLKDSVGNIIDTVNSSGGAWFAGDSTLKASMERIDSFVSGDDSLNWGSSTGSGSSATASGGAVIVGTPGMINSGSAPAVTGSSVSMFVSNSSPNVGETVTIDVLVSDASDLFSYGVDIVYDPSVLTYVSSSVGDFLSEAGTVSTSFQSGLEDGAAGTLVVAEARTIDPKVGIDGVGTLYSMTFNVVGGGGQQTDISFGSSSFLSDVNDDVSVSYTNAQILPQIDIVDPVVNLVANEGVARYSIALSWDGVSGVDGYMVSRKGSDGFYVLLGQTSDLQFVDSDAVSTGGNIIPFVNYEYRVVAVKGAVESSFVDVVGSETRGIKGDNTRSDRVDGRDLDNLARHFAEVESVEGFDLLVDTTYDGVIDGSDLIDLGASFALVYSG